MAKLAAAPLVFAGPGSPTYALRQWQGTLVPPVLAEKLALGGALTFASAAALTLGAVTVPVYEVYKVGEDPHWVPGLDLLAAIGLHVALIPHYDNAEGGTHDTRFCYLGEQRLARLERELPEGAFVLGVDEHSALCIDLDAGRASVAGHGGVTVRVQGRSARIEAGEAMDLSRIVEMADELASGHGGADGAKVTAGDGASGLGGAVGAVGAIGADSAVAPRVEGPPLLGAIRRLEESFRAGARGAGRGRHGGGRAGARRRAVGVERRHPAVRRPRPGPRQPAGHGRRAGRAGRAGARDPAVVVGPFVELALTLRDAARRERRFADADAVRDRLVALGVEVNDTPDGSQWRVVDAGTPG